MADAVHLQLLGKRSLLLDLLTHALPKDAVNLRGIARMWIAFSRS